MINTTRWNRWRYSLYAPVYDVVAERAFRRPRRQALAQVRWQSGMRVLLVGAGTGLDLPWLPRDIEVHASDLCPAMVKRLKVRANHLGVDVEARAMDAEQLDYPDGYFDVVVMHLILAVMPQPDRGLAEIIIGKQRNGPTGSFKLKFSGEYSRFDNLVGEVIESFE